jgi:hypothetical protein
MIKKIGIFFIFSFVSIVINAQNVDVDKKSGLVSIGDKETFYLTAKNTNIMGSDFSLENLQHQELAYLKKVEVAGYRNGHETSNTNYLMVFTKSGNQCTLTGMSFLTGIIKPIAKKIAGANLVQNGEISFEEERKFLLLNNGTFINKPTQNAPEKVIVINNGNENNKNNTPANIVIKDNKIYNNSELAGIYKFVQEEGNDIIKVYNSSDAQVCSASHKSKNDNDDWKIVTDEKSINILYDAVSPLEKLFKYLVEKNIL